MSAAMPATNAGLQTASAGATAPGSRLLDAASGTQDESLLLAESTVGGLTTAEAARRLALHGPNEIAAQRRVGALRRLLHALRNPLVILLALLATVSLLTGDLRAAIVMAAMILLGVG